VCVINKYMTHVVTGVWCPGSTKSQGEPVNRNLIKIFREPVTTLYINENGP